MTSLAHLARPPQAWGKFRPPDQFLAAADHMADVALCLDALLGLHSVTMRAATLCGRPFDAVTRARLCVLGFLHDIGKLSSAFQAKLFGGHKAAGGHVREGLALFDNTAMAEALALPELGSWGEATMPLFLAALAHHGRPVARIPVDPSIWQPWGGYDPVLAAREAGLRVRDLFPAAFGPGPELPHTPAFQHFFAGLVALTDQIGSQEADFPVPRDRPARPADDILRSIGLDTGHLRAALRSVRPADLFEWPRSAVPKAMQIALADLPLCVRLAVLESETGSGKTEAAILRFLRLFEASEVDALYFALPTRAAANQIFGRVRRAVHAACGAETVLALPGYLHSGDASGTRLTGFEVAWDDAPDDDRRRARWSAETPRRFLAAPFAVGTVDQAMLAGLKVKWAHFRAAALARSYLVVDEVHASNSYMTAVLGRLVQDHVAMGGHALLMSATLGAAARAVWLGGPRAKARPHEAYPAISWREGAVEVHQAIPNDGREKRVTLAPKPLIAAPDSIAAAALAAAARGARVLVIRNTVDQAVAVAKACLARDLSAPLLSVNGVSAPHHSRYAAEDRRLLDRAVETAFGKGAPSRGIIAVGTQTLEQSLDIDADLLLTDLCPIDVLLQRLGRLHRHVRNDRPPEFDAPRAVVMMPEALAPGPGLLAYGLGPGSDGGGVYPDTAALEAVRRLVGEGCLWTIPGDNRRLVEAGTDPATLEALAKSLGPAWEKARQALDGNTIAQRGLGHLNCVDRSVGFDGQQELFDDDRAILTRLGAGRTEVPFRAGQIGPFGKPVSRISVSWRWGFSGLEELTGDEWRQEAEVLVLDRPEGRLTYGPFGLRKEGT